MSHFKSYYHLESRYTFSKSMKRETANGTQKEGHIWFEISSLSTAGKTFSYRFTNRWV